MHVEHFMQIVHSSCLFTHNLSRVSSRDNFNVNFNHGMISTVGLDACNWEMYKYILEYILKEQWKEERTKYQRTDKKRDYSLKCKKKNCMLNLRML